MLEFATHIASAEFAQLARHPDSPNAFTRCRQLPLPALVAALLTMRGQSQQVMLDGFFGGLCAEQGMHRGISDRGRWFGSGPSRGQTCPGASWGR